MATAERKYRLTYLETRSISFIVFLNKFISISFILRFDIYFPEYNYSKHVIFVHYGK